MVRGLSGCWGWVDYVLGGWGLGDWKSCIMAWMVVSTISRHAGWSGPLSWGMSSPATSPWPQYQQRGVLGVDA